MATDKELGTRIKRARERLHWRQIDLARAVSVDVKTVGNWERGQSSPRNRLGAIEATLGVRIAEDEPEDEVYTDPVERAIWEEPRLPRSEKIDLIAQLRARRREHVPRAHEPPA